MKYLITSALPYVNNVPHLGNIIGCVLSADVFARYCRSRNYETLYVCGTDEYGTATEAKALEEKTTPQAICDKYHTLHADIYKWFGISTDIFGRTSTKLHTEITHEIFLALHKNGFIVEEEVEQPFDEKLQMFLADRFVLGTCPHCQSTDARSDQCDKCGKLLTFAELISPKSKLSGATPVIKSSRHLFIDLPKMQEKLSKWIVETSVSGAWSPNSTNIAKAWLAEGLKRRAITRDLKWGVPVPLVGWENKVFYVWFDAPIGYLSITANLTPQWREWWMQPDTSKLRLFQFMGKDNVPFHTVIFPSTMMGTSQPWTMLHHISTTEFLNYEDGKFSKSKGIGVFGNDAVESGIPADVWRYYLLANRPENSDTTFSWKDFGERNNNELLANYGNLVNRTLMFISQNYGGKVPEGKIDLQDEEFISSQKVKIAKLTELLEGVKIREAVAEFMSIAKAANGYFQENAPWKAVKENPQRANAALYVLANQIKDLAILGEPFLPFTSAAIWEQLNLAPKKWDDAGALSVPAGHQIGTPSHLYRKLEQKELDALKLKHSGRQLKAEGSKPPKSEESKPPVQKLSVSDVDFEVGQIIEVKKHPQAEKLYIERVQMGGGEILQICSGLVPFMKEEELMGKKIIVVKNLKPAKLRGVESAGMLLAAESSGVLEVISPDVPVGTKVRVKNAPAAAPKQQITIDEFFTIKLELKNRMLLADGKVLAAGEIEIHSNMLTDAKVS